MFLLYTLFQTVQLRCKSLSSTIIIIIIIIACDAAVIIISRISVDYSDCGVSGRVFPMQSQWKVHS